MSRYCLESVACPACGHTQEVKVYVSVSADRMRSVADRVLDGSWERMACTACAHLFVLDHRMVYTDLPQRRWIVQHPRSQRARYPALEEEAAQAFRTEYLERPPEPIRAQARGVAPRICFGWSQLAEKLLAGRHGIDDRALECLKLVVLRNHLDALFPLGPSELQLAAVEPEQLMFMVVALESGAPLDRLAVARGELDSVADDLESFRPAYPELFDRPFVSASRYLL